MTIPHPDLIQVVAAALAPWCTGEMSDVPPVYGSHPCERDLHRANDVLIALAEAGFEIRPKYDQSEDT